MLCNVEIKTVDDFLDPMDKEGVQSLLDYIQKHTDFTGIQTFVENHLWNENPTEGVYICDLNYSYNIKTKLINYPEDVDFPSYGVADNYEQIIDKYHELTSLSQRKFCILCTPMRKSEQYPEGGWRWHKWGEYIGTEEPTCEYLYDEPVIEEVYVFHIYEINE